MLSNSDPKNTDESDNFFDDLYNHQDFSIHRVGANRNINSDGAKRGQVFEILVTNYEID
jgi:DNA adenine methylase